MTLIGEKVTGQAAKKWPALIPLSLAMVVVAGWVGNSAYNANGGNLGFIIGSSASVSLIVWAALYFPFVQKTGRKVGPIYWTILFATGIGSGLAVSSYDTMQAKTAVQGITHGYNAFLKGEPVNPKVNASGDLGQVEAWMKNYLAVQMQDRQAYKSELEGSGVANLLAPARLKTDSDLKASKVAVIRGREIVKKYHALYDSRVADAYALIDRTTMRPSMKAQVKSGMNETMTSAKTVTDRVWALEAGAVDEMGAVIDLLDRNQGTWSVKDRVVFQNPDVLASYNAHVTKLQEMGKEEEALRAQAMVTSRGKMNELEALTK